MSILPDGARLEDVAVVAIGRNEGARLERCLGSVIDRVRAVVYVDSGSTDGSVDHARGLGAKVVALDMSQPFTAARARNAGFEALAPDRTTLAFVQFVDGDCEVEAGWMDTARAALMEAPGVAVVFGRRRERFPEASIYNRLCDEEWNIPPGPVEACGGDAMMRAQAFADAGGYRAGMIAGEEPELCVRLRQRGWKIFCLDAPMTIHDAAITRFSQWWRRAVRSGHAFAEGAYLHGGPPVFHSRAQSRRIWRWGLIVPSGTMALVLALGPVGLVPLLVYPLQVARLYHRRRTTSTAPLWSSIFTVLGNFPEAVGQIRFHMNRVRGKSAGLIEYK